MLFASFSTIIHSLNFAHLHHPNSSTYIQLPSWTKKASEKGNEIWCQKNSHSGIKQPKGQVLSLPPTSWESLDDSPNCSELWFPHLQFGHTVYLKRLMVLWPEPNSFPLGLGTCKPLPPNHSGGTLVLFPDPFSWVPSLKVIPNSKANFGKLG